MTPEERNKLRLRKVYKVTTPTGALKFVCAKNLDRAGNAIVGHYFHNGFDARIKPSHHNGRCRLNLDVFRRDILPKYTITKMRPSDWTAEMRLLVSIYHFIGGGPTEILI